MVPAVVVGELSFIKIAPSEGVSGATVLFSSNEACKICCSHSASLVESDAHLALSSVMFALSPHDSLAKHRDTPSDWRASGQREKRSCG